MTHFKPENGLNLTPRGRAPGSAYKQTRYYFPLPCTDVVPENTETGELFFGRRAIEPRKGQWWFIGGRALKGASRAESASSHLANDAGYPLPAARFNAVSHWDIDHIVDREGQELEERSDANTVFVVRLRPHEVTTLNCIVAALGLGRPEYSGSAWFSPADLRANPDLQPPVRQFLRDYDNWKTGEAALYEEALAMDAERARLAE